MAWDRPSTCRAAMPATPSSDADPAGADLRHRLRDLTRPLSGRSALAGGRDHTSHRLVALGVSERTAVLSLYALAAGGGALALVAARPAARLGLRLRHACTCSSSPPRSRCLAAQGPDLPAVADLAYRRRVLEIAGRPGLFSRSPTTRRSGCVFPGPTRRRSFHRSSARSPWSSAPGRGTLLDRQIPAAVARRVRHQLRPLVGAGARHGPRHAVGPLPLPLRGVLARRLRHRCRRRVVPARRQPGGDERDSALSAAAAHVAQCDASSTAPGRGGTLLVRELPQNRDRDLDPVGFIDDDPGKQRTADRRHSRARSARRPKGCPVWGVTDVIVSVRNVDPDRLEALLERSGLLGIRVRRMSSSSTRCARRRSFDADQARRLEGRRLSGVAAPGAPERFDEADRPDAVSASGGAGRRRARRARYRRPPSSSPALEIDRPASSRASASPWPHRRSGDRLRPAAGSAGSSLT